MSSSQPPGLADMPLIGTSGSPPPLVTEQVGKRFGGNNWALRDVSLRVNAGTITGLIGPNGAGKTTLMRLWMGFDTPTSGRVEVIGRDPATERSRTLTHIAYMPQTPALYRDLTVSDHLVLAAHYRALFDRTAVERRLAGLRIPLSARVGRLSGGQTAQLGLTLAFGLGAEVLLLDEPLASLDPLARTEVLTLLEELTQDAGATVVISSHVIEDITKACDHIVVLGAGALLLSDSMTSALSAHTLSPEAPSPNATLIADLVAGGPPRRLWRTATGQPVVAPAPLSDIVLAYLTLGRGMNERSRV